MNDYRAAQTPITTPAATPAVSAGEEQMCLFDGVGERIRPVSVVVSTPVTGACSPDEQERERTSEEIAELFGIAAQENDVIACLTQCADHLRTIQNAKSALARLSAPELRAALRNRHLALVQPAPEPAPPAPPTPPTHHDDHDTHATHDATTRSQETR